MEPNVEKTLFSMGSFCNALFFAIEKKANSKADSFRCPPCVGITYFPGPSPDKYFRRR